MELSPIILFAYNRPDHLKQTLEALSKNALAQDSDLYIFIDGPRNEKDEKKSSEIVSIIKNIDKNLFRNIYIEKSHQNKGLAQSIIDGVSKIIKINNKIIVLEDDIVTSPNFLKYMNSALELYKEDEKVFHISGFFYPHDEELPETFFLHHISSWGWATWQNRWLKYKDDTHDLIKKIKSKKNAIKIMNIDNTFNFFSTLKANDRGKIRTWAIKWQSIVILNDGLCLFPKESLVRNIGNDGSGENSEFDSSFDINNLGHKINIEKIDIRESQAGLKAIKKFFKKIKPSFLKRVKNFIAFNLKKH